MSTSVPLALPAADAYPTWLEARAEEQLAVVAAGLDRVRAGGPVEEVLAEWNAVGLALANVFAVASLFSQVHPDPAVQEQAETIEQRAQRTSTEIGLDRGLFDVLSAPDPTGLAPDALRFLERSLRDFRRSGVDRDDSTRERLRRLSERQTEVGQQFSRTIRDSVGRVRVPAEALDGLPEDFVLAHPPGDDGLVELTTEYPDYVPVMTFARDRGVRERLHHAFLNRGWPDNDAVLSEVLTLRAEQAVLLGYPSWPDYDAEVKMIGSSRAITDFIDRIATLALPAAERDFEVLLEQRRLDDPSASTVTGVDKAYCAERVRQRCFEVDAQEVRRYLDFTKVRAGLLEVTGRLFGLAYTEREDLPVWHPEVTAYDVRLEDTGELLGRIYLDLHPRPGKYSHAAQFTLTRGVLDQQLPEGVLVCNFPRGLMEHRDVVTLFHEFGHLLHHVLAGRQRWVRFSGVATEWDFVEAPSQMLEEWAWDHSVLSGFATDEAGEAIPASLVERMRTAEEFGKGYNARTQMYYAAVSYTLHRDVPSDLTAAVRALQERYDLFEAAPDTHFHASFGHLGGYTSAYYTYMWSLVIAKDLFSAFDRGDLLDADVARRYRDCVLVPGGSKDAADLVADFLGRPASFEAFESWLSA